MVDYTSIYCLFVGNLLLFMFIPLIIIWLYIGYKVFDEEDKIYAIAILTILYFFVFAIVGGYFIDYVAPKTNEYQLGHNDYPNNETYNKIKFLDGSYSLNDNVNEISKMELYSNGWEQAKSNNMKKQEVIINEKENDENNKITNNITKYIENESNKEEFYKEYEINSLYAHGNTIYYDIPINKMPIVLN